MGKLQEGWGPREVENTGGGGTAPLKKAREVKRGGKNVVLSRADTSLEEGSWEQGRNQSHAGAGGWGALCQKIEKKGRIQRSQSNYCLGGGQGLIGDTERYQEEGKRRKLSNQSGGSKAEPSKKRQARPWGRGGAGKRKTLKASGEKQKWGRIY